MSEYVTPTYLLSHGRLSELLGSLPLNDSVTATIARPGAEYEVTAARVGVTVFMLNGGALTVRALPSEAHAVMFMDEFRSVVAEVNELIDAAVPTDFMVI